MQLLRVDESGMGDSARAHARCNTAGFSSLGFRIQAGGKDEKEKASLTT
jgi:hypothetical protein